MVGVEIFYKSDNGCMYSNIKMTQNGVKPVQRKCTNLVFLSVNLPARVFQRSRIRYVNSYSTTKLVIANPIVLFDRRQTN